MKPLETEFVPSETPPLEPATVTRKTSPKGTFWSRYNTLINFWLDVLLLILFMIQAWMFAVLRVVFPRGAGSDWKIWGATPLDWSEALFTTYCIFAAAVVLHVMFHWTWICAVVATRFFHCKPGKDDGSHTLIGVSVLVFLVHLLVIGILATKVGLVNST